MSDRVLPATLLEYKKIRRPIAALTAYDYPTARLLDEAGIDFLLVGDSLGMVVLGLPDTTEVTLADIIHHTRPVARGAKRAMVVSDLPIGSYDHPESAVNSALELAEAGAQAVKLEGARTEEIAAITEHGVPVVAHLGMLPQRVRLEGGYKIKGKTDDDAQRLIQEALQVEKAGAIAIVLELIVPAVAAEISRRLTIPTIGIGSGKDCDGQILVTHDLLGFYPWFTPRFATPRAAFGKEVTRAAREYIESLVVAP